MSGRRTKVDKHRGIYFREGANGRRRYEVTYTDKEGRQRWKTVDGSLAQAEAAREELRGRVRRGERIAPSSTTTVAELAESWLASQTGLRWRTRERYEALLRVHVLPSLGRVKVSQVTVEDVLDLIGQMREGGSAGATIKGTLGVVSRMFSSRPGRALTASNPIAELEKKERPASGRTEPRILERDEIFRLLDACDERHRPMIATAVFAGLRQGELLGLTWSDVDLDAGLVHVRKQLDRRGERVAPKTDKAVRSVELFPALVRILRAHKEGAFALGRARPQDFVFASSAGTPLHYRNVSRRGLDAAMTRAGLDGVGVQKLRFHDLRHTFASALIAQGQSVVFVSRQLGHASAKITLDVYSHLFDRAEHGQLMRDGLEASFGKLLESAGGDRRRTASATSGEIVHLKPNTR
ncbi:MAG: tyrosine-type recombinase/integrase [Thermoleophilia bacterium]